MKGWLGNTARYFTCYLRDRQGVAAVEFALIVPILFMLFAGTIEFSQALTVERRVSQVANATADLVAQTKSITTGEVAGIMEIVGHLMRPYDPQRLRVTILNVIANISRPNDTRVCWSFEYNGGTATYTDGEPYPLPDDVVEPGGSVIVTEVEYDYVPMIFSYFIKSAFSLKETHYLKPRLSSYVQYNGMTCG